MKPIDCEKILFPVNALLTAVIFFLINPAIHIYAGWFPDKKDSLWLVPVWILGISAVVWFFTSLSMPWMIRKGIFEDRRLNRPLQPGRPQVDVSRVAGQILNFLFHMIFLLAICFFMVSEMKKGTTGKVLFSRNISWNAS